MRHIFILLALLLSFVTDPVLATDKSTGSALTFSVRRQDYMFSTVFEISSPVEHIGSVYKSSFSIRTHYDLYDSLGNHESNGICRVLTLGVLYSWAREIDVYDAQGMTVGMIDGQLATGASAKFSIYNAEGNKAGIAYLDKNGAAFSVVDPANEQRMIASLKRNFVANTLDHWDVTIYDKDAIDMRILKTFAAFAVDSQNDFKKDQ